jgi:hypothetical protein
MTAPTARRVVTRSGKHFRGKFPSRKLRKFIEWESIYEAETIRLFEFNVQVVSYQAQPSKEHYTDENGVVRDFYPDFRVHWADGRFMFVEVKSDADLSYAPTRHLLGLKAMAMQAQGKTYRVLTPKLIRKQPRFGNLKLLEAHMHLELSDQLQGKLKQLDIDAKHRIADVAHYLGSMPKVFGALAVGVLRVDLELPLDENSLVWHPHHKEAGDGSFSI